MTKESDDPFALLDGLWKEKEHLRAREEQALHSMPEAQRSIDYGDYWVLPAEGTLVFGYVPTLIEQAAWYAEELFPQEQVDRLMLRSQYEMIQGWMTCEIDGERWYWIHKTLVIPIEGKMYEKARTVEFDPLELSPDDLDLLTEVLTKSRQTAERHFGQN